MFNTIARLFLAALMTQLALIAPVQACDINNGSITVFYDATKPPEMLTKGPQADTLFIGKVSLKQKPKWLFFKPEPDSPFYAEIHSSQTHPELVGTKMLAQTADQGTSCRPSLYTGASGPVTGDLRIEAPKKTATLYLHGHIIYVDEANALEK